VTIVGFAIGWKVALSLNPWIT